MVGESVLSLLIVEISEGAYYYVTFYSGILSITLTQTLHFQSQPHDPDKHALRRDKIAGFLFMQLLYVYSASLIVLGASKYQKIDYNPDAYSINDFTCSC